VPSEPWDPEQIIRAAPSRGFNGTVWRVHWRAVAAVDWRFSLHSSGQYHRGLDLFADDEAFAALYTSLAPEIAIWEMVRRSAARDLSYLKNNVLAELEVDLDRVLDLSNPSVIGMSREELTGPDHGVCQDLAATAVERDFQGLLAPSAALPGSNLVIFPRNLPEARPIRALRSTELPLDTIVQERLDPEQT
jgi:RES domain-containing protein